MECFLKNLLLGEENVLRNRELVSNITDIQIRKLFDVFGNETIFGRGDVMLILDIKEARGSDLLRTMLFIGVIIPVKGYGKGKYRFIKI